MNDTASAYVSPATRFWSGLFLRGFREEWDQARVVPIADRYFVRVHDDTGWRELELQASADLFNVLVPELKVLVGYAGSDPIAPPGLRCVLRLVANKGFQEFQVTIMTSRTEAGAEEVLIELPRSR